MYSAVARRSDGGNRFYVGKQIFRASLKIARNRGTILTVTQNVYLSYIVNFEA